MRSVMVDYDWVARWPDTTAVDQILGREDELAQIRRFLEGLRRGPSSLVLEGEPGIGKTTLWAAGIDTARELGYQIVFARPAETETQLSFAGLADICGPVADEVLPILPDPQRRALEVALLLEEPEESALKQRAVAAALLGALRQLSSRHPLVIAIDDVQWLDASSAAVLEFALRRIRVEPVGALLSWRLGNRTPVPSSLGHVSSARGASCIEVGPLGLSAIHEILLSRLGDSFPRSILARIHEMSGGNPFFALELARALDQRGGPIEPDEPLPVPGELRALLNDRLDALPEPTQAALIVASALSQPTIPLLRRALGPDVEKALVPAFEAHIAEREGERIAFAHPLHSFATYSRVSPEERRELHTRLAALVSDPEERARHLAIAVERPDEAVALALERGARSASLRGATHSAAELCARARHLTPAERLDNIRRRGMAEAEYRILATDSAGARDVLEEIIPLARPGLERAELLRRLADAYLYGVDWRASADTYRQARAEAGENDTLRAKCEMGLAVTAQVLNAPVREMREHARAAAELAERAGEPSLFRAALAVDALSGLLIGDKNPWETIEQACALEPSMEGGPIVLRPSQFLAHMLGLVDDFPAALAGFEEGVRQAVESGDELSQGWLLARMSQVACLAGTWKDALHHLAAGDEVLVQAGQPANTAFLLSSRALVEAHFGRASSARRAGEAALEIAQKTNAAIARKIALWALGHLALSLGQPTEAHARLEPIVAETRATGIREPGEMRFFPDEIEALVMLGEIEAAASTLRFFQECATSSGRTSALAAAARCQGLIAAANGDVQRGLEALRASALAYEDVQLPSERARTLLTLGSVSLRARQKRLAREALEDATAGFERLGAEVWAARARAELARIGGRPRSDGSLTPTEWRVAELVAQGRTNREVAAALFVTVRTVEGHLSRIYPKLSVRSRSELVRHFADQAALAHDR